MKLLKIRTGIVAIVYIAGLIALFNQNIQTILNMADTEGYVILSLGWTVLVLIMATIGPFSITVEDTKSE